MGWCGLDNAYILYSTNSQYNSINAPPPPPQPQPGPYGTISTTAQCGLNYGRCPTLINPPNQNPFGTEGGYCSTAGWCGLDNVYRSTNNSAYNSINAPP